MSDPHVSDPLPTDRDTALRELEYWWAFHDAVERRIIRLERMFSDEELDALLDRE